MKAKTEIEKFRSIGLFDWAKNGMPVWILNKRIVSKTEIIDYQPGVISEVKPLVKKVVVKLSTDNSEREYIEGLVFQRSLSQNLVTDLVEIPILNEAEILTHFELIFKNEEVYCYCGPALIAVNPYKIIPKTTSNETLEQIIDQIHSKSLKKASSHVWTVSAQAYLNLKERNENQSICINGESGSGKTESIKKCLYFLAAIEQRKQKTDLIGLADRILACNPILESFGNCTTHNNDNSSRFGKYLKLGYSPEDDFELLGATMENYLLEKTRVVAIGEEQRSFHIFYAMCRASNKEFQERYLLSRNKQPCNLADFSVFKKHGFYINKNIDDFQIWNDVVSSFKTLDFSATEQDAIWRIISAILHITNFIVDSTNYEEGRMRCSIVENIDFNNAVRLLSCSPSELQKALSVKVRFFRENNETKELNSPYSPENVKNFANSMAKELYTKLFNWIFKKLNSGIRGKFMSNDSKNRTIGLLDIFGFEIDEINSLNQLFINYTNEQLQNVYINHVFKNECRLFEEEGLGSYINLITFNDNLELIKSIDSPSNPPGIFSLLNQVCILNQTDDNFIANLQNFFNDKTYIYKNFAYFLPMKKNVFVFLHSAKDVEYTVAGFVDNNKDEVPIVIVNTILNSHSAIAAIYNEIVNGVETAVNPDSENPKDKFITMKFSNGINSLMRLLSRHNLHFVRCIKPNNEKKANLWKSEVVLRQITYMGLLDSLKIRKYNYHIRYSYEKFYLTFQDIDGNKEAYMTNASLRKINANFKTLTENLLNYINVKLDEKEILFGKTMVFMNDSIFLFLEKMLQEKIEKKKEKMKVILNFYQQNKIHRNIVKMIKSECNSIILGRDLFLQLRVKIENKNFQEKIASISRLQKWFRNILAKKKILKMSENTKLLIKYYRISSIGRKIKMTLKSLKAIKFVADLFRVQFKRRNKKFARKLVLKVFDKVWNTICEKSTHFISTTIQSYFRSFIIRKKNRHEYVLLTQNQRSFMENYNATKIQAHVRGFLVRKRLKNLSDKVKKIQNLIRSKWIRQYFLKLRKAVIVIQRAWRKVYIRKGVLLSSLPEIESKLLQYDQLLKAEYRNFIGNIQPEFEKQECIDSEYKKWSKKESIYNEKTRKFILEEESLEINTKARLFSIPFDVYFAPSIFDIYQRTWSKEMNELLDKFQKKGERLLHIYSGSSSTIVLTDELKIYSFGCNDRFQLAQTHSPGFYHQTTEMSTISRNLPLKIITRKDKNIMISQSGLAFAWGHFKESELSIGSDLSPISSVLALNQIEERVIDSGIEGLNDSTGNKLTSLLCESGQLYLLGYKESAEIKKQNTDKSVSSYLKNNKIDFFEFENEEYLYNAINNFDRKKAEISQNNGIKILSFCFEQKNSEKGENESIIKNSQNSDKRKVGEITFAIPNLTLPPKIVSINCGCDFSIMLLDKGFLIGIGSNSSGQLGLGDTVNRDILSEITFFREQNDRVLEISCGFKHVVCRTAKGKIYSWGNGSFYQTGSHKKQNVLNPALVEIPKHLITPKALPISIQATAFGSNFFFDDMSLFSVGKTGLGNFKFLAKIPYSTTMFPNRMKEDFIPVKISTSWSESISISMIHFLDFRNVKQKDTIKSKISEMVLNKWKPGYVLPFYDNNLANYMNSKCFLRSKLSSELGECVFSMPKEKNEVLRSKSTNLVKNNKNETEDLNLIAKTSKSVIKNAEVKNKTTSIVLNEKIEKLSVEKKSENKNEKLNSDKNLELGKKDSISISKLEAIMQQNRLLEEKMKLLENSRKDIIHNSSKRSINNKNSDLSKQNELLKSDKNQVLPKNSSLETKIDISQNKELISNKKTSEKYKVVDRNAKLSSIGKYRIVFEPEPESSQVNNVEDQSSQKDIKKDKIKKNISETMINKTSLKQTFLQFSDGGFKRSSGQHSEDLNHKIVTIKEQNTEKNQTLENNQHLKRIFEEPFSKHSKKETMIEQEKLKNDNSLHKKNISVQKEEKVSDLKSLKKEKLKEIFVRRDSRSISQQKPNKVQEFDMNNKVSIINEETKKDPQLKKKDSVIEKQRQDSQEKNNNSEQDQRLQPQKRTSDFSFKNKEDKKKSKNFDKTTKKENPTEKNKVERIDPEILSEVVKILKKDPMKWSNIEREIMSSYASLAKNIVK